MSIKSINKKLVIILTVMVLVPVGVLAYTYGATMISLQAESGTLTASATLVSDASASGGQAIKFTNPGSPVVSSDTPGWLLNENNIGLTPYGLTCASLPVYTGPSNVPANTTIYRKRVTVSLNVSAGNVTIDQSCVRPTSGSGMLGIIDARSVDTCMSGDTDCIMPNDGLIVRDSEIDASLLPASAIAGTCATVGNGTYIRNYVHGMGSGICIYGTGLESSGWIQQNYITGLRSYGESHNEAATVRDFVKNAGDTRKTTFKGNRMYCDGNVTATIFLQPTWDPIYNVWLIDNYFEGGGYNIYNSGGQTGAHMGNLHATNNRVRSTGWGPATVDNVEGWNTWSNNYIYAPGNPDAKGALIPDPS